MRFSKQSVRESFRIFFRWTIASVMLSVAAWGVLLTNLDARKRATEHEALHEISKLARNYAKHLDREIDTVDQLLLHIKFEWELSKGSLRLEQITDRGLFTPLSEFNVQILDRSGKLITSTHSGDLNDSPDVSADFLVHRNSSLDAMHIGQTVLDTGNRDALIRLSRKLTTPDGEFDGVVGISVQAAYFTATYDNAALGPNGFLAVVGADRTIRAARVGDQAHFPGQVLLTALPHFARKHDSLLLSGERWFSDKRNRYVGWQTLGGYPLIAMAGIDEDTVLAPYFAYREASLRYATLTTLALLWALVVAMIYSTRLSSRKRELELTQTAYRMATEEGIEGFYILRPIYNDHGKIKDFLVADCNSRGAELFDMRTSDMIVHAVSTIPLGLQSSSFIEGLYAAMTVGIFEGDIDLSTAGRNESRRCLHLKIVRSHHNLAVRLADVSDAKSHLAELERRGNEDALTRLPNRHWANTYLPRAIAHAAANHKLLALLFIDLDGFKEVNDTLGHEAGDELLRNAGRRLKLAVRPHDHVVRIGGDEFVVIIEQIEQLSEAAQIAERVLHAFEDPFGLSQGVRSVGTSIGISAFPEDGTDANILLRNADIAMYAVKTSGKNSFRFYDEMLYQVIQARRERELELKEAVRHNQLVVHYQPRVYLASGIISSMEALVRWNHPSKGLIGPADFIPLAEETGVILQIGEIVIEQVCAQLAEWQKAGEQLVPVSINVSARQFNEVNIADILHASLARHQVDPSLVEIELTESTMMGDSLEIASTLRAIQHMGVKLLVDDFGTGYSSLSQLQRLDFDVLKVDQAFTAQLENTKEGNVLFRAIITMAHALGMRVVAEGVETDRQVEILRALQCDEIQGFYICKPLPPSKVQTRLKDMIGSLPIT